LASKFIGRLAFSAVFAVFPANYQRSASRSPQISSTADGLISQKTARSSLFLSLFPLFFCEGMQRARRPHDCWGTNVRATFIETTWPDDTTRITYCQYDKCYFDGIGGVVCRMSALLALWNRLEDFGPVL